jgi:hypothetical protein
VGLSFARSLLAIFVILLVIKKGDIVDVVVGAWLEVYVNGVSNHREYPGLCEI